FANDSVETQEFCQAAIKKKVAWQSCQIADFLNAFNLKKKLKPEYDCQKKFLSILFR
ncbi:16391_t:CDS:1, partial [Funneliformis mosseae]